MVPVAVQKDRVLRSGNKIEGHVIPAVYQTVTALHVSGAPNENIVQNHLNIALLKYFSIKTVDIGIFLSPKNFSSVRIS